jgi:hypothetical protein
MGAAGASGALGSGTTQAVDDLLEHRHVGLDVVESAAIGGTVSLVTVGAGRAIAPYVAPEIARFLPGQIEPLASDAQVVKEALQRNVPWSAIPRIIWNQPISELAQRAELGIIGALGGARDSGAAPTPEPGPAPAPPPAPPPRAPAPPAPLDAPLGD